MLQSVSFLATKIKKNVSNWRLFICKKNIMITGIFLFFLNKKKTMKTSSLRFYSTLTNIYIIIWQWISTKNLNLLFWYLNVKEKLHIHSFILVYLFVFIFFFSNPKKSKFTQQQQYNYFFSLQLNQHNIFFASIYWLGFIEIQLANSLFPPNQQIKKNAINIVLQQYLPWTQLVNGIEKR